MKWIFRFLAYRIFEQQDTVVVTGLEYCPCQMEDAR